MRLEWDGPLGRARTKQITPNGDWRTWLILAGRGWGKTDTGAHDIGSYALFNPDVRCAVVAPTAQDLRITCFEGESGLLGVIPPECFKGGSPEIGYNRSFGEIWLANGSKIEGFAAEKPGRLRGPQFHRAWSDELAAWQRPDEAWDMLQFALRLDDGGDGPRNVVTTTPKAIPLLFRLTKDRATLLTTGSTYENSDNLAPGFLADVKRYEGTTLGRQEIHAELIDLSENAILPRSWWKIWGGAKNRQKLPSQEIIVLSFDTAYKDGKDNDYTAMTAWGLFRLNEDAGYSAILLGAWKEKLRYPDMRARAIAEIEKYTVDGEAPDYVLIEDTAAGPMLIEELHRAGIRCHAISTKGNSKIMRAAVVSDMLRQGLIWAPGRKVEGIRSDTLPTGFALDVMEQCEAFRGVKEDSDDYVDTCSQAWSFIRGLGVELPSDEEDEDKDKLERNEMASYFD